MLALFKGELAYKEFMYGMTYKEMIALRDARIDQLVDEQEQHKKEIEQQQRENIRNNILK